MIGRALLFAALALGVPATMPVPVEAAQRDWSKAVMRLPSGAYRIGNPQAKVRVVEYLSMTCSHCATFAAEGLPVLKRDYVTPGRVSIEFRHALLNGFDLSASLLARCGGAARVAGDMDAILAAQPAWLARAQAFRPAAATTPAAMPAAYADGIGLTELMAKRGLPRARAAACLADKAEQERLVAMRREAFEGRQLHGTPAFLVNDALTPAHDWAALKPLIDAALR